jgi:hypothetical protein
MARVTRKEWYRRVNACWPAPAAAPAATLSDARKVGLARTLAAIARWEAKQRRAENALRKLTRRKRYYERAIAAREAGESVGVSRCQTAR